MSETGVEEIPTLKTQLAACTWADKEAARLAAGQCEAPPLSRPEPPPQKKPEAWYDQKTGIWQHVTGAFTTQAALYNMLSGHALQNEVRLQRALSNEVTSGLSPAAFNAFTSEVGMHDALLGQAITHGQAAARIRMDETVAAPKVKAKPKRTWFDEQTPPRRHVDGRPIEPARVGKGEIHSSTYSVGSTRCYLTTMDAPQKEVIVPRTRAGKPAAHQWSRAGAHQKVGWNLYTDLFECQDCGKGQSTIRDLEGEECK